MKATFRALTTVVAVDIDDELPSIDLARGMIASYETSDAVAELSYQLRSTGVTRAGAPERVAEDPRDIVPLFELDLYEQVIARAAPGWILHAAAVEVAGRALVLVGPSGAGKTTMTLALIARGHRLLTEEVVWTDGEQVRGLSRPLHVLASTATPNGIPAGWTSIGYPIRTANAEPGEHAIAIPPREALHHRGLSLHALVRLIHGPTREVGLARLSAREGLAQLWDATLRPDDAGLAVATHVLQTTPAYRLSSREFSEALAALDPLLK